MKSLIASILGTAVVFTSLSTARADDSLQIHGFAAQGFLLSTKNKYMSPDSKDGSFEFNEFGINFGKNLTDDLRVGIQLFARDLGTFGNDTVTVDWAYGDYRFRPWLGVRVGKIKLPIGLYNETRDMDAARTGVFLPQAVYFEMTRESLLATQGVSLYGRIPLGRLGAIPYQLLAGSTSFPAGGSFEALLNASSGGAMGIKPTSNARNLTASVEWETPLRGLRLAFSEFYTHWDQAGTTQVDIPTPTGQVIPKGSKVNTDMKRLNIETYSAEFIWRDLTVAAEYTRRRIKMASAMETAPGSGIYAENPDQKNSDDGFYVSAAYRFAPWLEVGSYYGAMYANADGHSTEKPSSYIKDIDLSLRFDVFGSWILKLEAHKMYGTMGLVYQTVGAEKDWWFFASKASFSF